MSPLQVQLKEFWQRLSLPDLFAAGMVLVGTLLLVTGKSGGIFNFLRFVALLCAGYLLVRFIGDCEGSREVLSATSQ
jgi:lipopolysaccharide export LptBFGC system permease protein LptF